MFYYNNVYIFVTYINDIKRVDFKDLVGKTIKRIDANFEYLGILTEDDCFAYLETDVLGNITDCKSIEDIEKALKEVKQGK